MKSIANQYRDLKEGKMSEANFMRNLRMTMPQFVTNVTSFGDAVKILKNKSIIVESAVKEEFRGFNHRAIEAAADDKISHTEQDDEGEPIYWSEKNPYVNYYIGSNDQIIKYDGKTGERYPIGNLGDYDQNKPDEFPFDYDDFPSKDDYDADYEEPREDFDMAEGEGDEDAMYDAMIKKIEDELAAMEAANAQYDEALNEALNKDIKAFGQDLDKRFKEAGFDTLVLMQPATPQQLNIVATNPKAVLFEVSQTPETQMLILHVNPKVASKAESIINKFQFSNYTGPILKRGWTAKQVTGAINPGDIYKQDNDKAKGLWYFYRLAKVNTTVKTASTSAIQPNQTNLEEAKKPNVEKAEDENLEEVTLGIFMEHACFPDKSYEEIEKIVKKNIKKNPNYYTNYKLTGIRDYEVETMDSSKPEDHQMKFYTEKTAIDTARGMQKVKMPKKEEKKKLKEARFNVIGEPNEVAKQVMQFVDGNNTLKALSDDIEIQQTSDPNEALLRYQYWDALPSEAIQKLQLQFNVEKDSDSDEDTGEIIFYRLTPLRNFGSKDLGASFEKMKKELEEIVRETINEYFDGRDNLINPLSAEDENN